MPIDAVIVAAGAGRRMGVPQPKQYLELGGRTVLEQAVCRLARFCPDPGRLVVVLADGDEHFAALRPRLEEDLGAMAGSLVTVTGGAQRQDSVWRGLQCCSSDYVMIHDAARPLVQSDDMQALCAHADGHCAGAILAVPVSDTLKRARDHRIEATVPRQDLYRACTPQLFMRRRLLQAYAQVHSRGLTVTDEAMAMECAGEDIALVAAGMFSLKITHREDMLLAGALLELEQSQDMQAQPQPAVAAAVPGLTGQAAGRSGDMGADMGCIRIGHGFDVHAFGGPGPCVLCGVQVPHEQGLLAHSDGDVAVHAVCDAILGALALGDIGHFYPDHDERYRNIDSMLLLDDVVHRMLNLKYRIANLDVTLMAQAPRLAPYIERMRSSLAGTLQTALQAVSVKATTTERLGFVGRREGIAAEAVVLLMAAGS